MTDELTPVQEETKAIAQEASTEANFNFLDRLAGRNYPTETVEFYIDEAAGYLIQKLEEQAADTKDDAQVNLIHEQIKFQREKAAGSKYTLHLQAISVDDYDSVVDASVEAFPVQYKEGRNPLTLAPEKEALASEDRDQFFRTHLWAKFITKIVGPDGGEDTNITPEWVAYFMGHAPIMATFKVSGVVEKLRMVGDWMDAIQTDDFFPKP